jgi:hypothetical protein
MQIVRFDSRSPEGGCGWGGTVTVFGIRFILEDMGLPATSVSEPEGS